MLRHIAWFNEAPVAPRPEGGLASPDELVCRRCLVPARAIEALGVGCSVFGNLAEADPAHVSQHLQKLGADIVVIGEISEPMRLKLARAAKHLGCYVVADFGAEENDQGALTHLMQVADQAVAATPAIAAKLEKAAVKALVIPGCEEKNAAATEAAARLWLECFKQLKLRPSAGANQN